MKTSKAGLLLAAAGVVSLLFGGCARQETAAPPSDPRYAAVVQQVERMTQKTMRRARIPGLSIVLVGSAGTIWQAGFGWGDDARAVPVNPDTMFSIQSMSKTFTAVGVLTAVQQGLLDLDQPLSKALPGFRVQSIFQDDPASAITLRHLLLHVAGFTHEAPLGSNYSPAEPSFDDHVASIQNTWLMFRAGERCQYSNLGIDLAAYMLEKADGKPFVASMQDRVFSPLGLTRSTLDIRRIRAEPNRATGHQFGSYAIPLQDPMLGAGGVYSCARDLGAFMAEMLRTADGKGRILTPAAWRQMSTTARFGGYGLGLGIGRRGGDLYFNHGGGGYGFLTYMAWYPTLDFGIAVLTNSSRHNAAHVKLAEDVVDLVVSKGLVTRRYPLTYLPVCGISLERVKDNQWYFDVHPQQVAWRSDWSQYTGTYQLSLNVKATWWASALLRLRLARSQFLRVRHAGTGMTADGEPLVEAQPGLFFSLSGEALDFRSQPPTWRNVELTKR